jgi:hypothetical protein
MQLKMFVGPIKNVSEAEAEMNGFLRGHRVLAVKKEFVADGENSFWTFCVNKGKNRTQSEKKTEHRVIMKTAHFIWDRYSFRSSAYHIDA